MAAVPCDFVFGTVYLLTLSLGLTVSDGRQNCTVLWVTVVCRSYHVRPFLYCAPLHHLCITRDNFQSILQKSTDVKQTTVGHN